MTDATCTESPWCSSCTTTTVPVSQPYVTPKENLAAAPQLNQFRPQNERNLHHHTLQGLPSSLPNRSSSTPRPTGHAVLGPTSPKPETGPRSERPFEQHKPSQAVELLNKLQRYTATKMKVSSSFLVDCLFWTGTNVITPKIEASRLLLPLPHSYSYVPFTTTGHGELACGDHGPPPAALLRSRCRYHNFWFTYKLYEVVRLRAFY